MSRSSWSASSSAGADRIKGMTATMADQRVVHNDQINHPPHYTAHPSGVECIDIVEHMSYNVGNAVKYLWRAGLKEDDWEKDMRKAVWYVEREIKRLKRLP